ncbi:Nse1 non-SMC component of SMC5-6 complex-domain-containing protein [Aspergillus alliaceus]|uniref:Non-structural maintenance of chromosomes element 1 homolog n=1 Tax=Petromyces alliaceus TaxID=209559 RepID=A0A5N7C6H6_PETAA|nr:Nse1 non-SMC component of SMC5-6 complex-domain-containing protein [Aspergillus alliaceus]
MASHSDGSGYNDSNRAFLQAFMARSSMTFAEARPVLAAIFSVHEGEPVSEEDVTEDDLSSYIAAANTTISPFDLEIRSTLRQSQIDPEGAGNQVPERVYALVNTTSDALTQLATTYSADEIAFVKRLLDAMFDTNNTRRSEGMVISGMQAIQLAKASARDASRREPNNATQSQGGAAQSLSMSQAETVLKQLVEEGWLEKSRRGFYSLSPRGLMELRGWLVATYNDENEDGRRLDKIKFCAACRDIITMGQRCGNRDCSGRLHDHCIRNFFRMQQAEQCPVCKAPWPGDKFVGERAITSTEQYMQGRRQSTNAQRQSGVGSSSQIPSEDGVADSD